MKTLGVLFVLAASFAVGLVAATVWFVATISQYYRRTENGRNPTADSCVKVRVARRI